MKKMMFCCMAAAAVMLLSCSAKRMVTAERDTLTITRTDTVRTEKVVEKSVKEYIDRWNDRLVVVTPLGDTVKDWRTNTVYVERDTHMRDSVAAYKSQIDSLRAVKNRNSVRTVGVKPALRHRIGEAAMWMIIGAVIMLVIIKKAKG